MNHQIDSTTPHIIATRANTIDLIVTLENRAEFERNFYSILSGTWCLTDAPAEIDCWEIADAVKSEIERQFPDKLAVHVTLYHTDGRAITGDCPSEGKFLTETL